jgi:catalase
VKGFKSYPEKMDGIKVRERSETFADHYSQARQFYLSQNPVEQHHIASALIFELSKVEKLSIRVKLVGHLLNIDDALANKVATGLGISKLPEAEVPARVVNKKLKPSAALSILKNSIHSFSGRKLGVLLSDGADAGLYTAIAKAIKKAGASVEYIVPKIGGVKLSDGTPVPGNQNIAGGPSVLYDAIAIVVSQKTVADLAKEPSVRDFLSDAFAHFKFIAYVPEAELLFKKFGLQKDMDAGCVAIKNKVDVDKFMSQCAKGRYWKREEALIPQ